MTTDDFAPDDSVIYGRHFGFRDHAGAVRQSEQITGPGAPDPGQVARVGPFDENGVVLDLRAVYEEVRFVKLRHLWGTNEKRRGSS
jgi:hypothetical protein